jgi:16S rRNA (cytosine1402-N4)-methyltransferase
LVHDPVLLRESCEFLVTNPDGTYFDGTIGFGGHTREFLKKLSANGKILATDLDESAFQTTKTAFEGEHRVQLYNVNFSKIDQVAKIESVKGFDGIFADLGVSSFQLDNQDSGFSFKQNAKLDLRMSKMNNSLTAAEVVNTFSTEELSDIFYHYGEEKNARKIARRIEERRTFHPLTHAQDIEDIVRTLVPPNFVIKTMTRVFQALRIYINDELDNLKEFLEKSVDLLLPGGRIVILSYHSLEDRIVKELFKYEELSCVCPKDFPVCRCDKEKRLSILTKKPVTPSADELSVNYRSRSAKLRAAERV